MKQDRLKQEIISKLTSKALQLGRLPKKSDFENDDVQTIKSVFKTWPNALEQAGLILPKSERRLLKNNKNKEGKNVLSD